jgi:hypothetical protein
MRFLDHVEGRMEILLTIKELAAALKLTGQTIQRYVLRKEIPYLKMQIPWELLLRSLCRILYSFIFYAVPTEPSKAYILCCPYRVDRLQTAKKARAVLL